ncbi:TIGR04282 family arsenosugar biosynthesis glycosyltransferase [soil metagenome]
MQTAILYYNMETALIIMVHNSVPFTVKAGKVTAISMQESAAIHNQLLTHIYHITTQLSADKFVFSNEESKDSVFFKSGYKRRLQRGRNMEEKTQHAFQTVFSMGYKKVVVIASSTIETAPFQLQSAFDSLNTCDVVIGPIQHGNYYLLGMKALHTFLFANRPLHTSILLQDTLKQITNRGLTYHLQAVLNNAEEENEHYLLHHRQ